MRQSIRIVTALVLLALPLGCDDIGMLDSSAKPDVTGNGPREPEAPGKKPSSGKDDLGAIGPGGPTETKAQVGPGGSPKYVSSPDGKAH